MMNDEWEGGGNAKMSGKVMRNLNFRLFQESVLALNVGIPRSAEHSRYLDRDYDD